MADIPDRTGWLEQPLASYPPVAPFPQLTHFERRAPDVLAGLFGPDADEFRLQIAASCVTDRVDTVVGFYTRIEVDRAASGPLPITHKGAHFDVPGTRCGMSVTLWDDDGYLSTIEGVTYGEDSMGGQELTDLDSAASNCQKSANHPSETSGWSVFVT